MKNVYLAPIKAYQYISKMLPASCRYYPSCSEYASWQFEFNHPSRAFVASSLRILRCNQLFKGGIDYPLVRTNPHKCFNSLKPNCIYSKISIHYWLVPKSTEPTNKDYYVIKDFDVINAKYTP
ncbi:MAG: Protein YidD [uncultured Sulfurovum sp.]|uniref:Protein YidD n=1 Tax=uncultured Sulfurovum sp. TaxID=269237 RepID=A0A6S6SSR5_9BACT|nr:MAG: Protein YidD [uncultured Sulfurovum sp.]